MSNPTVASALIAQLEHPISALEDQPSLAADDLKAYFDGDSNQLCEAHNTLVEALTAPEGASGIGFTSTAGVPADNLQEAVINVQQQLRAIALGSIPDGTITVTQLDDALQSTLGQLDTLIASVNAIAGRVETIRPSGAQYPLMVLALADNCPDDIKDDIASAALGVRNAEVYDLGIQLAWLCRTMNAANLPSSVFRSKQNLSEILSDTATLNEIESLTPVRRLISMSSEVSTMYYAALDNVG